MIERGGFRLYMWKQIFQTINLINLLSKQLLKLFTIVQIEYICVIALICNRKITLLRERDWIHILGLSVVNASFAANFHVLKFDFYFGKYLYEKKTIGTNTSSIVISMFMYILQVYVH